MLFLDMCIVFILLFFEIGDRARCPIESVFWELVLGCLMSFGLIPVLMVVVSWAGSCVIKEFHKEKELAMVSVGFILIFLTVYSVTAHGHYNPHLCVPMP